MYHPFSEREGCRREGERGREEGWREKNKKKRRRRGRGQREVDEEEEECLILWGRK